MGEADTEVEARAGASERDQVVTAVIGVGSWEVGRQWPGFVL